MFYRLVLTMMVMITTMTLRKTTITTVMMIMVMMLIMMPMQNPDVVDPKESLKYASNRCLPPPWYKGRGGGWWWMEPLPRVFDMLQYFKKIFLSVESLLNKMRSF